MHSHNNQVNRSLLNTGMIYTIQRFSVHDGPGIRTTVFMKGCPLDCWWCQNPESIRQDPELMFSADRCTGCRACAAVCPVDAISYVNELAVISDACIQCGACAKVCLPQALEMVGRTISVEDVLDEVMSDAPFYEESGGGVTFSGGEPLEQSEFIAEVLRHCKARGLHTAVDTSGCAAWSDFERVLPYVDLFLFDVKHPDAACHKAVTGVSNALILENLERLCGEPVEVLVRFPFIPGVNDSHISIAQLGKLMRNYGVKAVEILPYHTIGQGKLKRLGRECRMKDTPPPSDVQLIEAQEILKQFGIDVSIGG